MNKIALVILLMLTTLTFGCASDHVDTPAPILRVCVLKDVTDAELTIKGAYELRALKTGSIIGASQDLSKARVLPTDSGLSIGGREHKIFGIRIVPNDGSSIYIGKRSFRGSMAIIRDEKKKLLFINHIDVESYLKGVLYHEVSHWWPMEVLKAQAIAARTYAMYQKSIMAKKDYDMTNDIYSQVYGGRVSERYKTNRAVELTRGEVLTFKNEIFPTYYHATCGGRTEDASYLWNIDIQPLKGRKTGFCKYSPHYNWKHKMSIKDIEAKLNKAGYGISGLKGIIPSGSTPSGRVESVKVLASKELVISSNKFRIALDPNKIRSTNFSVKRRWGNVTFYGRGWGHGVGMCQWGAFFLSMRKYKAKDILRYYYPGAKIALLKEAAE